MKTVTLRKAQRFNPYLAILLLGFFGLTLFAAPFVQAQERVLKKRIAVITFEDKSDQSVSWGEHYRDAGDGMADMLTTVLVESGRYGWTRLTRAYNEGLPPSQQVSVSLLRLVCQRNDLRCQNKLRRER